MNASELIEKIIAFGADAEGIRDRFGDNAELYGACFSDFLTEQNFQTLRDAMERKDYPRAFDAAHALKGLSGNLGVNAFYDAICKLVESLRAKSYAHAGEEYEEVCRQQENLARIFSGEQPDWPGKWEQAERKGEDGLRMGADNAEGKTSRKDRFMFRAMLLIVLAIAAVGYLFFRITAVFRDKVMQESGQHLIEMSNQIKLYVEEQIDNDWRIAQSVGDSLTDGAIGSDDADVVRILRQKRDIWGVTDLMLYTGNGYTICADGTTEANDIASDMIVKARTRGRYMSVLESKIIYTIPLETDRTYLGERIVAVSVVQEMETFLDDMHFSSFDGKAWLYLTEESGVVISRLTNPAAVPAFNFKSILADKDVRPLAARNSTQEIYSLPVSAAYLMTEEETQTYVVSVPVETGDMPLRVFYLAPEAAVNSTMNGFSTQLTTFSMTMIFCFGALAFLIFLFLYRSRKALFDKALLARERMFELLVANTRTAFAMFRANAKEPVYMSGNAPDVIGDAYWTIDKTDEGYRMRSSAGDESEAIRQANDMLAGWDGKSAFKSGYILNDAATSPNYFEYQLYPIDGEGMDFVGIAQDVTQAYEREEATKSAMEMAMRANDAKSRFLSNMSHDIRTPMNAIMNMTTFAQECVDEPKKLGPYLHVIRESSEHLLHLINEVLDMSRIESGQTVIASTAFNLREEMQKQVEMVRPLCNSKGQTLITDFSGLAVTAVCGDALKVSQIIMNLLSNAIKFTPENGAVRFTVMELPSLSDELVDVRFVIEDNGIGVKPEDLTRIFEPFCRADDKRVGKIEGTGLGLSICKSYVEAMGGVITCESEEGEGSVFTVELFFRRAEKAVGEHVDSALRGGMPFLGMHCLVVEDNATNQLIAKALLERTGFIVDFADDGRAGVTKFLAARPGTYDVIYMDIRMPVMDGYEATAAIRASDHPEASTIPIVAMTANVYAEDMEKARIAGMDAYLGKPLVSFDLIEQTSKALQKKRG